mmetsp:Transcript_31866/g.74493  ORF Transcript_31866/g.74493 Transcript_31866/m.74493 type:complete len:634 (+) Transcript_31866:97-1998(+)
MSADTEKPLEELPHAGKQLWRVLSGAGGRLVRQKCELGSKELPDTLRPGSVVEELELRGSRLQYRLLSGSGPETGWVTIQAKAGALLERLPRGSIWIITMGTRGDLQPFVVLALALKEAGFNVRIFGPPELGDFDILEEELGGFTVLCAGWATTWQVSLGSETTQRSDVAVASGTVSDSKAQGLDAGTSQDVGEDTAIPSPNEGIGDAEGDAESGPNVTEDGNKRWLIFLQLLQSMGVDTSNNGDIAHMFWLFGQMPQMVGTLLQEIEKEKPDIVIYNHLSVNLGQLAWRKYGIKAIFANLGMEFHFAPKKEDVFNYGTLRAVDLWRVRPHTGIAPVADMTEEEFNSLYTSPERLLGTSSVLMEILSGEELALAKTWDFTGFWIYGESRQLKASDAFGGSGTQQKLQGFLDAGSKPVYLGWGSMPIGFKPLAVCLSALRTLGLRAIFVEGWSQSIDEILQTEDPEQLELFEAASAFAKSSDMLVLKKAPHEWLFRHCACVVHHGGAGTTAAALRSAVPMIVCPFGYDQPMHGELVEKLGVGIHVTSVWQIEVDEMYAALKRATMEEQLHARAAEAAERIRSEPGVAKAVQRLHRVLIREVWSGQVAQRWEEEERARELKKEQKKAERKLKASK